MRRRPWPLLLALTAALAVALAVAIALTGPSGGGSSATPPASEATNSSGFDGAVLSPSPAAPGFALTDQHGRSVSLSDYRGQVTILTFLYSRCGASCTLIAQQIRGALDELPKPVPVVIVSADPAADSPASIRRFLEEVALSGRAEYLTGPVSRLRAVWHAYRITPASTSRAAFDRFASLWLLDAKGRERVLFEPEVLTPESLAHDIRKLQDG